MASRQSINGGVAGLSTIKSPNYSRAD